MDDPPDLVGDVVRAIDELEDSDGDSREWAYQVLGVEFLASATTDGAEHPATLTVYYDHEPVLRSSPIAEGVPDRRHLYLRVRERLLAAYRLIYTRDQLPAFDDGETDADGESGP